MPKHYVLPSEIKTRAYKLLLYPDNKQHMQVLHTIQRNKELSQSYIGIWHTLYDSSGKEIISGSGKKHAHLLVYNKNPVWWGSFCKTVGFVHGDTVDCRFCMPINVNFDGFGRFVKDGRASLSRGFCYLIHLNTPDKEQYTLRDCFGSTEMIENAGKAIDEYLMRNISMRECVYMVYDWIMMQDSFISYEKFISWICTTPYFKAQSSPLIRTLIDERNRYILKQKALKKNEKVTGVYIPSDLADFLTIDEILSQKGF